MLHLCFQLLLVSLHDSPVGKSVSGEGRSKKRNYPGVPSRCLMLFGIYRFRYKGCEGIASYTDRRTSLEEEMGTSLCCSCFNVIVPANF